MSTAADLIRRALKLLGVLAAGEPLRAEDQADCLVELNLLLGTWANQRLLVHGVRRSTHTLTSGLSPHTLGVGGTFDTARPVRIDGAGIIPEGGTVETPLELLTDSQYEGLTNKATTSSVPTSLWVESTFPTLNLWLTPVPASASTLVLYAWSRIAEFASTDTVSLPDGYENALGQALALQVAPMYGVEPSGALVQNADDALNSIRRANRSVGLLRCDPAVLGGRGGGSPLIINSTHDTDSGGLY